MDYIVHRVTKGRTPLSDFHFHYIYLEIHLKYSPFVKIDSYVVNLPL